MLSVCGNVCVGVCVCVCMLPKKNSYPHMTFNLKINGKPVPCALSLDFSWFLNGYMALQKKKKKRQEFQLDLSAPSSLSLPVCTF